MTETHDDPFEESKPPRKKQKWGKDSGVRSPRQPQQTDGLVHVPDGPLEDSAKAIESDSESKSITNQGSEALAQSVASVQKLSTFDTSRSKVLSETKTEWTIRLHPNDVSIWPMSYSTL